MERLVELVLVSWLVERLGEWVGGWVVGFLGRLDAGVVNG